MKRMRLPLSRGARFDALLAGLADFAVSIEEPGHIPAHHGEDSSLNETKAMIQEAKKMLGDYWTCLAG